MPNLPLEGWWAARRVPAHKGLKLRLSKQHCQLRPFTKPSQEDTLELIELAHGIIEAISDKQGEDIILLDIREQSPFADYFVICSAKSERQIKAIQDGVGEVTLKNFEVKPRRIEGRSESGWVLVDFIGIVVHIFAQSQRAFYQLEDLWKEAPVVLKMQ